MITEATVRGHVTSIVLKLNARSRVEATLTAFRAGLSGDKPV